MPFNASGTYTLSDTIADATPASAVELEAILDDIQTALNVTFLRDGSAIATGQFLGIAGSTPQYSISGDTNTGFGSDTADQAYVKAGGVKTLLITATGGTVTGTLAVTGATTIAALAMSGDLAINTDKFTVTAASGNAAVAGTLTVTGGTTLAATAISGNIDVNTNKFNVTAANGNTAIAGTLAVTGNATLTAAVSAATAAGAMLASQAEQETATATNKLVAPGTQKFHPTHPKAFVHWNGSTSSIDLSFGLTSLTDNGTGDFTLNFSTAFSDTNYWPSGMGRRLATDDAMIFSVSRNNPPTTSALRIVMTDSAATPIDGNFAAVSLGGDYV